MSDDRSETPIQRATREYLEAYAVASMLEHGIDPDDYVYEVGKPIRRKVSKDA